MGLLISRPSVFVWGPEACLSMVFVVFVERKTVLHIFCIHMEGFYFCSKQYCVHCLFRARGKTVFAVAIGQQFTVMQFYILGVNFFLLFLIVNNFLLPLRMTFKLW